MNIIHIINIRITLHILDQIRFSWFEKNNIIKLIGANIIGTATKNINFHQKWIVSNWINQGIAMIINHILQIPIR